MYPSLFRHELLALITIAVLLANGHSSAQRTEADKQGDDRLREALEAMAVHSPLQHGADQPLMDLPADDVAPAVVHALHTDDAFTPEFPFARQRLYHVLSVRYAVRNADISAPTASLVYEQLLAGLAEADLRIKRYCAGALGAAPQDRHQQAASAVGAVLREVRSAHPDDMTDDERSIAGHLVSVATTTLGAFGQFSKPYLADIEAVFRDETANEGVRQNALDALIRLGGIEGGIDGVLDYFKDLDPIEAKILLARFGARGSETYGQFDGNPEHQQAIREFVIENLWSPVLDVRKAALESLLAVFGDDMVVFHSPTDYEFNPRLREALERMAAEEQDEGLRSRVASGLQQLSPELLDRAAQKIRHRMADQPDGNDPGSSTP